MIAQELHRNTCDDRQKGTVAIRDKNLIVDEIIGKRIAFVGHGNDRRSAGLHFLDIRKQLCVNVGLGCDYDDGTLFVDEGNRAVFHLGGGITFGVNVGNLFEFEGTFESDWKHVLAAEKKAVLHVFVFLRDLEDLVAELNGFGDERRCLFEGFDIRETFLETHIAQAAQVEGEHRENMQLGSKRFGRCDADFRAGVLVDAAIGFASDGRADAVVDRERLVAFSLGFAQRSESVDRFAGLADYDDECVLVEWRVAVAEFGCVFDFDRDAGVSLD